MGRIAVLQIGDQLAQTWKCSSPRFIGDKVRFKGRMILDLLDQRIELEPFGWIIKNGRTQQVAGQHGPQAILSGNVQTFNRRPGQVVVFRNKLCKVVVLWRRRAPEGDEE